MEKKNADYDIFQSVCVCNQFLSFVQLINSFTLKWQLPSIVFLALWLREAAAYCVSGGGYETRSSLIIMEMW